MKEANNQKKFRRHYNSIIMQMPKQMQSNLLDSILNIDEEIIRFSVIIDCDANTIMSRGGRDKVNYVTSDQEELFATDMIQIKQIQKKLDEFLGAITYSHIVRKKLHQIVHYIDNLIIYVTLEQIEDLNKINKISRDVEFIIKEKVYGKQSYNFIELTQ